MHPSTISPLAKGRHFPAISWSMSYPPPMPILIQAKYILCRLLMEVEGISTGRYNAVSESSYHPAQEHDPEKCKPLSSIPRGKMGTAVRQMQEAGSSAEAGSMSCFIFRHFILWQTELFPLVWIHWEKVQTLILSRYMAVLKHTQSPGARTLIMTRQLSFLGFLEQHWFCLGN